MKKRYLVVLVAILSLVSSVGWAQTSSGEIRGRVVDPEDAVVSDAQVTLSNNATGDQRSARTNSQGEFIFVAVQPGTFSVTVTATGFKMFEKRALMLSASERLSAGTLKLEVGAVSQTVSVEAEVAAVQTESAERSALLDKKDISSLTSLNRDPLALLRVLPGVVKTDNGSSNLGTEGAGTIAGVRESSNAVSIDGVNGNPRGDGNKLDTPVNMDAVQEIKVVLNSYQAEYGQSAGAIINLTTKSGTQDFHGGAYYYGRNEALNANGWFNNYKGTPRGVYRYNTTGWNIGGPAYIPGKFNTNKDKLFFFFSQERWPTKSNSGYQKFMMPTAAERLGDFSNSYDAKGQKIYIRNPALNLPCSASDTRGCYSYNGQVNVIDPGLINANMQKIMNIFPVPTIDCTPYGQGGKAECPLTNVTSGNYYNYQIMAPRETPSNQTLLRLDYNLNSQWKMYFRGMQNGPGGNTGLTSTTNKLNWGIPTYYHTPSKNAGLNLTYIASSNLVNEFTVGYSSWSEQQGLENASDLQKLTRSGLGVDLGQNNAAQNALGLIPRITGLSSGSKDGVFQLAQAPSIDFDNRFPMDNSTGTWEVTDGITKVWNNHTAKAGIYFQAGRYIQRHIGSVFNGNFNFGGSSSSPYDTNYAYSNMLVGNYTSYTEGTNIVNYAPHWNILEFYLQDTWKVKSNVTINYGVRFTYDLPTKLQEGMGAGFVTDRYDASQVPALYMPVAYKGLSAANQALCKGSSRTNPSRCAQDPVTGAIMPDAYIGTFVSPFGYTGTVINTDPTYPRSLRWGNGLLPAPRLGISWDPFKNGKTAVRFGTGMYYNTREGGGTVGDYSLIAPLSGNPSVGFGQLTSSTFQPGCGDTASGCYGTSSQVNPSPVDTRILQAHRKIESTLGVNFGIQQNIGWGTVLDVAYVGTFGRHLNQQLNLNATAYGAQFNPNYDASDPSSSVWNSAWIDKSQTKPSCYFFDHSTNKGGLYCQPKLLSSNYFRAYSGYNNVNLRDYGGTSNYNSLQVSANHRFSHGVQFGAAYTWSKAMYYMDTVDGNIANFQDRRFWNYGEAGFNHTQNFVFHWTANMPKASTLWNNRVVKAVGDNWEWSGIAQFMTGAPLSVDMSGTPNLTGGGDGARALLFGNPYASKSDLHSTLQYLNTDVWYMPCAPGLSDALKTSTGCSSMAYPYVPTADTPGITRANIGNGPGINNWDMALQKNIPIRERMKFAIRVEAFNVFNHVSFDSVNTTLDFDTTDSCKDAALNDMRCGSGQLKSTSSFGQVNGERQPRTLQLSARFTF